MKQTTAMRVAKTVAAIIGELDKAGVICGRDRAKVALTLFEAVSEQMRTTQCKH